MEKKGRSRQEVLEIIYAAKTLDMIRDAQKVIDAWLRDHPHDSEVRALVELLIRTEQALRDPEDL